MEPVDPVTLTYEQARHAFLDAYLSDGGDEAEAENAFKLWWTEIQQGDDGSSFFYFNLDSGPPEDSDYKLSAPLKCEVLPVVHHRACPRGNVPVVCFIAAAQPSQFGAVFDVLLNQN